LRLAAIYNIVRVMCDCVKRGTIGIHPNLLVDELYALHWKKMFEEVMIFYNDTQITQNRRQTLNRDLIGLANKRRIHESYVDFAAKGFTGMLCIYSYFLSSQIIYII
jgi:hypothetical protein